MNGDWTKKHETKIHSGRRPHIFYMAVLDCDENFPRQFSANPVNTPSVLVEWTMLNDGVDHFSYEDMGSLNLSVWLLCLQVIFGVLVSKSYLNSIQQNERYLSPHPIMLLSLSSQITAQLLLTFHLWRYSSDGEGFVVMDILSKIS